MKINQLGLSGLNPYKTQLNKYEQFEKENGKKADKVEISLTAKEMQQVSPLVKDRQARVEELKIQVKNGQYQVDPQTVAKAIKKYYSSK